MEDEARIKSRGRHGHGAEFGRQGRGEMSEATYLIFACRSSLFNNRPVTPMSRAWSQIIGGSSLSFLAALFD